MGIGKLIEKFGERNWRKGKIIQLTGRNDEAEIVDDGERYARKGEEKDWEWEKESWLIAKRIRK